MGVNEQRYVSASEISEYEYCNVAWYYQKENYPRSKISSTRMSVGRARHRRVERSYNALTKILKVLGIVLAVVIVVIIYLNF
ncbi:MAG: hypothetical protein QW597_07325 [Thermoplasmataceae archaeon]